MTSARQRSRNLLVGLSGPSSSGKTTIARLLRSIFNTPASASTHHHSITLFILHQDDFYKPDAEIPIITTPLTQRRLQDWDCAESLDLALLEHTLRHIRTHGSLPPHLQSKEDRNQTSASDVPDSIIDAHRAEIRSLLSSSFPPSEPAPALHIHIHICILDGFLLYPNPNPSYSDPSIPHSLTSLLSPKLFLRSTLAQTRSRRAARTGYVTLDGFWEDPSGYVDEVVWPNYVREHGWMFEGGDVEGGEVRNGEGVSGEGVLVGPGKGERGLVELLGWAVGVLGERVRREMMGEGVGGDGDGDE